MTQTRPYTVHYTRTGAGHYAATVTADGGNGTARTIRRVYRTEALNPSARGGAYRTEWVAVHGFDTFHADTRDAVVAAVVAARWPSFLG